MKRFLINVLLIAGVLTVSSCDFKFDELLDNPNEVNASSTNVDFLLNQIQVDFSGFFQRYEQPWAKGDAYHPPGF